MEMNTSQKSKFKKQNKARYPKIEIKHKNITNIHQLIYLPRLSLGFNIYLSIYHNNKILKSEYYIIDNDQSNIKIARK